MAVLSEGIGSRESLVPKGLFDISKLSIVKAYGSRLVADTGAEYLDFASGIASLPVGHSHPEVVKAITAQAQDYLHLCFNLTAYQPYLSLAGRLNNLAPGHGPQKTMLLNSGAEAVENAVKIARYVQKREGLIAFQHSFHGRTSLAAGLTGRVRAIKAGFGLPHPGIFHAPYAYCYRCSFSLTYPNCEIRCLNGLDDLVRYAIPAKQVAALIMEPILGEGGAVVPPMEFVQGVEKFCRDKGIILIMDEIQTGLGRTGAWFASEHFGVTPDLVLTAKALGGGLPLSGVTGRAEIMDAVYPGGLGTTFGGNPVCCRAGLAVIEIIEQEDLIARAAEVGRKLKQGLDLLQEMFPIIGDVRGLGAMMGIELVEDHAFKTPAVEATKKLFEVCLRSGLLLVAGGTYRNVLRLLPPLIVTDDELEQALGTLKAALTEVVG
ncbi:MAG: aspartate aminotransferase family protein [Deltaproteobacteria bacterium]|nr:aspartate aminotransferase family protein [Deltaproteobacteria bacterium]